MAREVTVHMWKLIRLSAHKGKILLMIIFQSCCMLCQMMWSKVELNKNWELCACIVEKGKEKKVHTVWQKLCVLHLKSRYYTQNKIILHSQLGKGYQLCTPIDTACDASLCPHSGEQQTQKLKSHLMGTQSLKVLHVKPGVGQYIAMHATLTARDFFVANLYFSSPFTCIFSKTSLEFFLC